MWQIATSTGAAIRFNSTSQYILTPPCISYPIMPQTSPWSPKHPKHMLRHARYLHTTLPRSERSVPNRNLDRCRHPLQLNPHRAFSPHYVAKLIQLSPKTKKNPKHAYSPSRTLPPSHLKTVPPPCPYPYHHVT